MSQQRCRQYARRMSNTTDAKHFVYLQFSQTFPLIPHKCNKFTPPYGLSLSALPHANKTARSWLAFYVGEVEPQEEFEMYKRHSHPSMPRCQEIATSSFHRVMLSVSSEFAHKSLGRPTSLYLNKYGIRICTGHSHTGSLSSEHLFFLITCCGTKWSIWEERSASQSFSQSSTLQWSEECVKH